MDPEAMMDPWELLTIDGIDKVPMDSHPALGITAIPGWPERPCHYHGPMELSRNDFIGFCNHGFLKNSTKKFWHHRLHNSHLFGLYSPMDNPAWNFQVEPTNVQSPWSPSTQQLSFLNKYFKGQTQVTKESINNAHRALYAASGDSDRLPREESMMIDRALSAGAPSPMGHSIASFRSSSVAPSLSSRTNNSGIYTPETTFPPISDDMGSSKSGHTTEDGMQMPKAGFHTSQRMTDMDAHHPLHRSLTTLRHSSNTTPPLNSNTGRLDVVDSGSAVNDGDGNATDGDGNNAADVDDGNATDGGGGNATDRDGGNTDDDEDLDIIPYPTKGKRQKTFYYAASTLFVDERYTNIDEDIETELKKPNAGYFIQIRENLVKKAWNALPEDVRQSYIDQAKEAASVPLPTKQFLNTTMTKIKRPANHSVHEGRFAYMVVGWVPTVGRVAHTDVHSNAPSRALDFFSWLDKQPAQKKGTFFKILGEYSAPLWLHLDKHQGALSDLDDESEPEEVTELKPVVFKSSDKVDDLRKIYKDTMYQRWWRAGRRGKIPWKDMGKNPMAYFNNDYLPEIWTRGPGGKMVKKEIIVNLAYLQKGDRGDAGILEMARFHFYPARDPQTTRESEEPNPDQIKDRTASDSDDLPPPSPESPADISNTAKVPSTEQAQALDSTLAPLNNLNPKQPRATPLTGIGKDMHDTHREMTFDLSSDTIGVETPRSAQTLVSGQSGPMHSGSILDGTNQQPVRALSNAVPKLAPELVSTPSSTHPPAVDTLSKGKSYSFHQPPSTPNDRMVPPPSKSPWATGIELGKDSTNHLTANIQMVEEAQSPPLLLPTSNKETTPKQTQGPDASIVPGQSGGLTPVSHEPVTGLPVDKGDGSKSTNEAPQSTDPKEFQQGNSDNSSVSNTGAGALASLVSQGKQRASRSSVHSTVPPADPTILRITGAGMPAQTLSNRKRQHEADGSSNASNPIQQIEPHAGGTFRSSRLAAVAAASSYKRPKYNV
ncbi:hypothetical protein CPB86DRAFT_815026 [Serendipita vermifera]|nr:hypothetical protein CPB86DRAFT_815026 [Serendipita vermifera]